MLTHFVGVQTDVTARVIAGIEYERLLTAEREARTVAERARRRLDVMVEVGAVLTETLDADDAMRRLAAAVVPAAGGLLRGRPEEQPVGLPAGTAAPGRRDPELRVATTCSQRTRAAARRDTTSRPPSPRCAPRRRRRTGEPRGRTWVRPRGDARLSEWARGPRAIRTRSRGAAGCGRRALVVAPLRARGACWAR